MSTAEKPKPERWRRPARSRYRITKIALAVSVSLLLTAGFTMRPAQAAVASTARIASAVPDTLGPCSIGSNNSYEYYGLCGGTGPTSYRAIAFCANGDAVFGVELWDGDTANSYASCKVDGLNSTLNNDWGLLLCSNNNGDGTYEGYVNRHDDISWILLNWGSGNIVTGGTTLCDYNTSGEAPFDPFVAPTTASS